MLTTPRQTLHALSRIAQSRWVPYVTLAGISLLGALLRAYQLGSKALWFDEAVIFWISRAHMATIVSQNATSNSAPPLFVIALKILGRLETSEAALRTLPMLAGVLCIPAIYFLGRQYFSSGAALLAALLVSLAPVQIQYSQQLREYSLSVLLSILMLLAAAAFLKKPSWGRAALLAAAVLISVFTQYGLALLATALCVVLLLEALTIGKGRKAALRMPTLVLISFLLAIFAVYKTSLAEQFAPGGFGATTYLASGYWTAGSILSALRFVYHGIRDLIEYAYPGDIFTLVFFAGVICLLLLRLGRLPALLLVLPFAIVGASGLLRLYPFQGARQDLFLTPLIYLIAAAALAYLLETDRRFIFLPVLILLLVRTVVDPLVQYYRSDGMGGTGRLVAEISDKASPTDTIYVCDSSDPVLRYYLDVRYPEVVNPVVERFLGNAPRDYLDHADALLSESTATWLLLDQSCGDVGPLIEHLSRTHRLQLVDERSSASLFLAH